MHIPDSAMGVTEEEHMTKGEKKKPGGGSVRSKETGMEWSSRVGQVYSWSFCTAHFPLSHPSEHTDPTEGVC